MASIVERNNSVSVVYYYQDEDGNKKQKWETVKKDQLDRSEIESAIYIGILFLQGRASFDAAKLSSGEVMYVVLASSSRK